MSYPNRDSLRAELCEHNRRLDNALRRQVGISVKVYKIVKNVTQLAAIGMGYVAIRYGADPITVMMLVAAIWLGPEWAEYKLTDGEES